MTERHEVIARLRQRIVSTPGLFGELVRSHDAPAIEIASLHHLYKIVNGRPLLRPTWYYDVAVQGDGLVDIQSHLVDQVQWMISGDGSGDIDRDVELVAARRWATPVPLALYCDSTGMEAFPDSLSAHLHGDVLDVRAAGR